MTRICLNERSACRCLCPQFSHRRDNHENAARNAGFGILSVGRGLKVPVVSNKPKKAEGHLGWLGRSAGHDMPAAGALTHQQLNWKPMGPGLVADLDGMDYTQA
jgi:hypothetical protein